MHETYSLRTQLPASAQAAFDWHTRPGAFERLTPPWQRVTILQKDPTMTPGSRLYLNVGLGPFTIPWTVEHTEYMPGEKFVDTQIRGPFAYWKHQHLFHPIDANHSELEDIVEYRHSVPFINGFLRCEFERLFAYRQHTLLNDLTCLQRYSTEPLRILVSGGTGLIGSALIPFLEAAGHKVWRLTRNQATATTDIRWDPLTGNLEAEKLENFDAVIHLAGENIASRWTAAKKERLASSRVQGTAMLVKALSQLTHPPKVLISASAIGFYGNRGDTILDEDSPKGTGFLADTCEEWEHAASQMPNSRVVMPRIGVVLSQKGGALQKMLTPFQLGLGGTLGDGKQYYSWIGIDDVVYHLYHLLMDNRLHGAVNLVSPNAVDNRTFTKTLGKVLHRPTVLPVPSTAIRLAFGEMGDALLLCSSKVVPKRLSAIGLPFAFPDLEPCLRHLLGKPEVA